MFVGGVSQSRDEYHGTFDLMRIFVLVFYWILFYGRWGGAGIFLSAGCLWVDFDDFWHIEFHNFEGTSNILNIIGI